MTHALLTYREYAALPDDGRRYEIHDGELSVTHRLGAIYSAPVDVILTDRSIVQPDIVFVDRSRLGVLDPEARAVEAYALAPRGYTLAQRASGDAPVSPPPFEGLALVPAALWPAALDR